MVAERRTEQVGVDAESVVVDEDVVEATLWVLDALHARPARARASGEGDLVGHLVADQGLDVVVEVGDEHSVGELAGADRVSVDVDGFEDDEVVGQVDAVAAEAAEHTLGHAVAVGDRCAPGLLDIVARFGQEWFGDGDDPARCDVQAAALGFHRQAWKKGAVGHEHRWLQLVEPVDDLLEPEIDGEQMPSHDHRS